MNIKRIAAGVAITSLALLGVGATAASAHTSAVTGVAQCQEDGTYSVTWTYNATNVPDGVEAETKVITHSPAGSLINGIDGQVHLSVWTEHQINQPGAPTKTGNWSAMFQQTAIPGTATVATTMVQTDWKNGPSEDPVGTVDLPGTCEPPATPPTVITVVPDAQFKDSCGVSDDALTFTPATEQFDAIVTDGRVDGVGRVQVDFTAKDGFEFPGGIPLSLGYDFISEPCEATPPVTPPTTPEEPEPTTTPTPEETTPTQPMDDAPAPGSVERQGLAVTGHEDNPWLWFGALTLVLGGLALYLLGRKPVQS